MAQRVPLKPVKKRSLWWTVHHWAGMKVSLFLTFILATGTFATLSHEIDWLLTPEMRATSSDRAYASWGTLLDNAQSALPAGARIERISMPYDFFFAAETIALSESGERLRVQLNPYSGSVQGITSWFNAQRLFRELHRHLMLPVKIGLPFVAILSLPMLASLITAFVVYKKWWRGFFRLPRLHPHKHGKRSGDARRFTGDLHRFAGLWCLWFIALIGFTGLWYLVEWGGGNAPAALRPNAPLPIAALDGKTLDAQVTAAQAAYPDLKITSLYFPNARRGGLIVMGQAAAILVRERANAVLINPASGEIVFTQKGEALNLHQRISEAADPLHFGQWSAFAGWGNFIVRLLWFFFGLLLTGLAVTGVMIFAMRLKPETHAQNVTGIGLWGKMWRGMGPFAYPSAALVSIGTLLAFGAIGNVILS